VNTLTKYETCSIIRQLTDIERFTEQMATFTSEEARGMCKSHIFTRTTAIRDALLVVALADIEVETPELETVT